MADDPRIDGLCAAVGIGLSYTDADGARHDASGEGKRHALASLGFDVSNEAAIAESLAVAGRRQSRPLPELAVVDADEPARIPLHAGGAVDWTLTADDGARLEGKTTADDRTLVLPPLPAGYHRLSATVADGPFETTLLCAPKRCYMPDVFANGSRAWGVTAQVYSLRGPIDEGIGTYRDVTTLAASIGKRGGAFLGLSPVHALFGADPSKFSPYSPSSRLFLQTGLIAPHAVAGFEPGPRTHTASASLIDYAAVLTTQRHTLEAIWERTRDAATHESTAFRRAGGPLLESHATFEALSDHFKAQGLHWAGEWPRAFRDARSAEVESFRRDHPERIAFHVWLQWLADTQLGEASLAANTSGMAIGLYRDLAVGADRGGSEVWNAPERFVGTLSVGAPPDPLGPLGQDWGLPPLHPLALASSGLAAFRDLVGANMRHAGALRIDHAFQLQRLFVLPVGGTAQDGVYLSYPLDALLASLKIESHRARCLVIGEDLGTAPPGFSDTMMDAGILSYRLLPFEREQGGLFKSPSAYPARALAALSTHDLPTFAGWWRGLDVDVRETLGVFDIGRARHERVARADDRWRLIDALNVEGLDADADDVEQAPDIAALRYLSRTPCTLVAVQIEDVLREQQQANLPGPDCGHPNWRRRSGVPVDAIARHPGLDRVACALRDEGRGGPGTVAQTTPDATYRLQLHAKFTFDDAAAIAPYLARLGVSHVYVSPIQMARPGSTHGYDVVDPSRLNPELGGDEAFYRFSEALGANGLRLLVDIVPNHVGVGGRDNPWWLDLLEWGRLSPHAQTFDVDWDKPGADGKLIVPFLGDDFDALSAKGEIKVGFEADRGRLAVWYADHCHPVAPGDYATLLARVPASDADAEALRALTDDFAHLQTWGAAHPDAMRARGAALRRRLASLCASRPSLASAIASSTAETSSNDLRALCGRQSWRLVNWTEANDRINYRRFFDITSLAGVRVENPDVFEASHALIFRLVEEGHIHGLRVDHVDGLADPAGYLRRLQARTGPGFPILVEKILEPGERLPRWPIDGTTGYDALHALDAVFFNDDALPTLNAIEHAVTGATPDRAGALLAIKTDLATHAFASETAGLVADLAADLVHCIDEPPREGDMHAALRALLAAFPVYRTYGMGHGLSEDDRAVLGEAERLASARLPSSDRVWLKAIVRALAGDNAGNASRARALRRFQQLTGPLMAKSFEDTLFYRDARFIAANEVGCGPDHPGIGLAAFHRANAARLADWPRSLIATATHDTKRGEDSRGRLLAASHRPDEWTRAWNLFRTQAGTERLACEDAYFLFQSLIAACPVSPSDTERRDFADRAGGFVEKFLREGKRRSNWTSPDLDYEAGAREFVRRCASPEGILSGALAGFIRDIALAGARLGIARTVLKCTVPGVPDIYQGTECADLSFVDPDNRRPVDYARRDAILGGDVDPSDERALLAGDAKLFALSHLLRDRRANSATYRGAYAPIATSDERAGVSFLRGDGRDALLVVAQRAFPANRTPRWRISLPSGEWRNLFDGRTLPGDQALEDDVVLGSWPAAVLRRTA